MAPGHPNTVAVTSIPRSAHTGILPEPVDASQRIHSEQFNREEGDLHRSSSDAQLFIRSHLASIISNPIKLTNVSESSSSDDATTGSAMTRDHRRFQCSYFNTACYSINRIFNTSHCFSSDGWIWPRGFILRILINSTSDTRVIFCGTPCPT